MATEMEETHLKSPLGWIKIMSDAGSVQSVSFVVHPGKSRASANTKLLNQCRKEFKSYFSGKRRCFTFRLSPKGTRFQRKVWEALARVPYGQTISYQDLAFRVGDKKASRAVAGAVARNPVAIALPCHRVIHKDGTLSGYAGGAWRKKWMLNLENGRKNSMMER